MKIRGKFPLIVVAALAWVVIISSCANIGMPTGGPKDSIPPFLVNSDPEYGELNFKGTNMKLTFSEYLNTDQISESLVISPPLQKKPTIRTKSKTLIVQLNEKLADSTTYSMDFKNSVMDNNEKNPIKNLRLTFSTGNVLDSLRVAGRLVNAFSLEPLEKGLVLLHSNLNDTAVYKVRPNYIAKTDANGLFLFDNIAPGKYHLFAINDLNSDLFYDEGSDEIAFVDSVVIPTVEFHESLDTMVEGVDSMLILGHLHFSPDPFYMRYFMEDVFEQYMESAERETRNKCLFLFNESVRDSFSVKLVNAESDDWQLFEYNENADSIVMWISDTTIANQDSLYMELSYSMLDTANEKYIKRDTMLMRYSERKLDSKKKDRKREKEEEMPEPVIQFDWQNNISSTVELNSNLKLVAPEPVTSFDSTKILLYLTEDTLKTPLNFTFKKNEAAYRSYSIQYKWEPEENYSISIDSAACVNIFGITSRKLNKNFKVREADYYGALNFDFSNVEMPMLVQLLKNNDEEDVLREISFDKDGSVEFNFLAPGKYKVKVIYDKNGNGEWDTGNYKDKIQPERVAYVPSVIKLRSNWTEKHKWDLTPDNTFDKDVRDEELEEQKRKEAAEKARKEKQKEQKTSPFRSGNNE